MTSTCCRTQCYYCHIKLWDCSSASFDYTYARIVRDKRLCYSMIYFLLMQLYHNTKYAHKHVRSNMHYQMPHKQSGFGEISVSGFKIIAANNKSVCG